MEARERKSVRLKSRGLCRTVEGAEIGAVGCCALSVLVRLGEGLGCTLSFDLLWVPKLQAGLEGTRNKVKK